MCGKRGFGVKLEGEKCERGELEKAMGGGHSHGPTWIDLIT